MPRNVASLFKRAAAQQGGLLSGTDPTQFSEHDPIRLWIIQLAVIIIITQLLGLALRRIRQPKVIAEVLGGIILGPTAFGRIPGFTQHIFPEQSKSYLSLTANIGLCLFLFLVGLEIDTVVIRRNARLSTVIALAGMIIPFGLGAALAVPIYHQFIDPEIQFTHFMLFTSVAFSITAFPVLCRILTELKLLDTTVGIVVLSAGVGNDVVGWVLLALSVALVNASSGLTALYILLVCVGWTIFLLFPVKWVMAKVARMTGSTENGPTMFFLTVTFLVTFVSAWFTDILGVHAIFGAFLVGLIIPREGDLAIALTERLEDMVSIIFLPLYFTLSGLNTDLGLLNNGLTWGYTIAICALAFVGKFGGCTVAAKYAAGFKWREACTIGSLMSCKGLVELIVLNIGLNAGILSRRVFSMFVLEALLLTFITTPLVTTFYPLARRVHAAASGANFNNVPDDEQVKSRPHQEVGSREFPSSYTVILDKMEHLPGIMAITQLLRPEPVTQVNQLRRVTSPSSSASVPMAPPVFVDALRLMELSDRTSAVMKSSVAESLLLTDPLLAVFRMFGKLNDLEIHASLKIVPYEELAPSVVEHTDHVGTDMVILPWVPGIEHSADEQPRTPRATHSNNPFDALIRNAKPTTALHSQFVRSMFMHSTVDVAVFVDQTNADHPLQQTGKAHHLLLPFFGGPDDRLALEFAMQLCKRNPDITATIMRCTKDEVEVEAPSPPETAHVRGRSGDEKMGMSAIAEAPAFPDTVYGTTTSEARLVSDTADNVLWSRYHSMTTKSGDANSTSSFLSRVEFCEVSTPNPLNAIHERARQIGVNRRMRTLIVVGRSRRLAVEDHTKELGSIMKDHGEIEPDVRKTIGDVATACLILGSTACGLIVVQAAHTQRA